MNLYNKLLKFILLILVLLTISGCNSNNNDDDLYHTSIQKGFDAIAEDELSKAEGLFEMALEARKGDIFAQAYLDQVKLLLEADILQDQNQLDQAINLLDTSITIKDGSKIINAKSNEKKEKLLLDKEIETNYDALFSSAKDFNINQEFEKSNEKLEELLQADLTNYIALKDAAIKLRESNNIQIKKAKKIEVEVKVKEIEEKNNPLAWNPGIKDAFEKDMIEKGYVAPDGDFIYRGGYIGGDGDGYYALYTNNEYGEVYIVVVNVKTGWYHG